MIKTYGIQISCVFLSFFFFVYQNVLLALKMGKSAVGDGQMDVRGLGTDARQTKSRNEKDFQGLFFKWTI